MYTDIPAGIKMQSPCQRVDQTHGVLAISGFLYALIISMSIGETPDPEPGYYT